ncbi:MAG: FAD-binding oxidoreductase [Alphaproteobacteria bacterium]|nr:FAD-binding oxidoreductase [Alphaproteobacteria bacterium]
MAFEIDARTSRRRLLAGLGGLGLMGVAGCAPGQMVRKPGLITNGLAPFDVVPPLAPFRMKPDRISKITVCLRPFRKAGPRLDVETVGDKTVVHNYGHGGSGWSLSWGSGTIATKNALAGGEKDIAVIGCGALGLTTATLLRRAGANVTIYASERTPYTRSARATGTWSPDSRIAAVGATAPGFEALWEEMCRTSYKAYQTYVGLSGAPVEWTDRYTPFDTPPGSGSGPDRATPPDANAVRFVNYADRVGDITPRSMVLEPGQHPFPTRYARRGSSMQFNVAEYAHLLTTDFLLAGGKIETMTFNTPADLAVLNQKVVVNCTGYGARALWKDESIIPVRGQIAWLIPQPEVNYGLYYKHVSVLPRRDGIVVQYVGETEAWGYNDDNETANRAEAEAAIAAIASLYGQVQLKGA